MPTYALEPSDEETGHRVHPPRDEVLADELPATHFEPLLTLRAGALVPSLDVDLHLLAVPIDALSWTFQLDGDGRYRLLERDGERIDDLAAIADESDPFDDEELFAELETSAPATLKEAERGDLLITTGEPAWLQHDASPGEGWQFIVQLSGDLLFGAVYVFFHPETCRVLHIPQVT